MRLIIALTTLAVLAAGWSGWSWWESGHSDAVVYGQARDTVLTTARNDIVQLNTLDDQYLQADLAAWQRVSTGDLLAQLTNSHDSDLRSAQSAHTVSTARALGAAVSALDTRAGTADVLVAIEVTVSQNSTKSVRRSRVDASMSRAGDAWKVNRIQVIE